MGERAQGEKESRKREGGCGQGGFCSRLVKEGGSHLVKTAKAALGTGLCEGNPSGCNLGATRPHQPPGAPGAEPRGSLGPKLREPCLSEILLQSSQILNSGSSRARGNVFGFKRTSWVFLPEILPDFQLLWLHVARRPYLKEARTLLRCRGVLLLPCTVFGEDPAMQEVL